VLNFESQKKGVFMRHKVERTGSYKVIDQDGVEHMIYVYTTFEDVSPLNGKPAWRRSTTDAHKMRNGNRVHVNDDGTLEEVATGRQMRPA
jgi:hypothetical protein